MLKGFAYHGITVNDLDRSVAFYRDVLHHRLEKTCELAGETLSKATGISGAHIKVAVLSSTDDRGVHYVKLIEFLAPKGKQRFEPNLCDAGMSHVTIEAREMQPVYDELVAKGVKFISPPVHPIPEHPEKTFAYLFDPDGVLLELHRKPQPHHSSHVVSELDRAVAFYRDVLGMKLDCILDLTGQAIAEGTGFPGVRIRSAHMVLDGEEYVELHQYMYPLGRKRPEMRLFDVGCSHIGFEVDDVQQAYREFRAKGAKFISQPLHQRAGSTEVLMVYMLDQDDYVVELRSGGAPV